jgi:hypothetical protein
MLHASEKAVASIASVSYELTGISSMTTAPAHPALARTGAFKQLSLRLPILPGPIAGATALP